METTYLVFTVFDYNLSCLFHRFGVSCFQIHALLILTREGCQPVGFSRVGAQTEGKNSIRCFVSIISPRMFFFKLLGFDRMLCSCRL
jgi:hypothetical protein